MKSTIYTFFFLLMFTNGYLWASAPNPNQQRIDYLSILPEEIKNEILRKFTDPLKCIQTICTLYLVNRYWNTFVNKPPIQKILDTRHHEIMTNVENIRKKHLDPNKFIQEIIALHKNDETFKKIFTQYKRMQYELANEFIIAYRYPLHKAAKFGLTQIVNVLIQPDLNKVLLAHNADVNQPCTYGHTPLFRAASKGHTETVKALLAHKADVNKANFFGHTPLFRAACKGHTEIVKALLAHKADVNKTNTSGKTPLAYAAFNGHIEIVAILLDHKAHVNKADTDGMTPILMATFRDHTQIVKMLLAHKADVNKASGYEGTPLFCAAYSGYTETVKVLLAHKKTKVNKAGKHGKTPLYWAERNGHTDIVELFKKKHWALKENS